MVPTLNLFRGILLSIILGAIFAAPVKRLLNPIHIFPYA